MFLGVVMLYSLTCQFQVFQTLTRRSALLEGYGHTTVRLSSANSYSYAKKDVTFNEYCVSHVHPQKLTTLGNGM